jgi:hypothetical protein
MVGIPENCTLKLVLVIVVLMSCSRTLYENSTVTVRRSLNVAV